MADDHLARLCFEGTGSTGDYTPHAFSLRLTGRERPADHIVYLHEVHHAGLNDMTAWGSALHVLARLPGDADPRFEQLLDACRTTHESLATYASVQLATARHGDLGHLLAAYPDYVPLYEATRNLVSGVPGANRRQQVVTALARLCMQTPVLDEMTSAGLGEFKLAALREVDRPDGRWRWFLRQGPSQITDAAQSADRATTEAYGPGVLEADGPGGDLYTATDRSHDEAWDLWEATAYAALRTALDATRARTMEINGHRRGTAELIALAEAAHGDLGLRAEMTDGQRRDDAAIASSVLQQVRHELAGGTRHRATLLTDAGPDRVVALAAEQPPPGDEPVLVLHARTPRRLAALFRWSDGLPEQLRTGEPVVAVRLIGDDGEPDGVVAHAVLPGLDDLAQLHRHWAGRGPLTSCVSAAAAADGDWAQRWLPALAAVGPLFLLVDVEPDRFVPGWARTGGEVAMIGLDLNDTGGRRTALLLTPDGGRVWWLTLATNDITVQLLREYVVAQPGLRLRSVPELFEGIGSAATAVITSLLATESFTSFDALGSPHA